MVYYGGSSRSSEVRPLHGRRAMLHVLLLLLLTTAACGSPSHVTFIPEGGSYKVGDLISTLDAANPPAAHARVSPEDIPEARQEALADLRSQGDDAAALADTLTSQFPHDVAAVPFSVERGQLDGRPAWIVIESWGDPGGQLEFRRLWVFSYDDLSVLAAHSIR